MKKLVYLAGLLLCAAILSGCAADNAKTTPTTDTKITLTAGIETTRTDFSDPTAPKWIEGDAIGVHFVAGDIVDNHYRLESSTISDGGRLAVFSGNVNLAEGDYTLYGYYPHGEAGSGTDNHTAARIAVPTTQRPTATSFDPAADVMVMWPYRHSHNGTDISHDGLQFRRALGMIRIVLSGHDLGGEPVQNLTFTTDAGIELAGAGRFDLTNGEFVGFDGGAATAITVEPIEVRSNGTDAMLLCVPAVNFPAGTTLTITGETENFTFEKSTTLEEAIQLETGNWHTMDVEFVDGDVTAKETELVTPEFARTTDTWVVEIAGGAKQIWSDHINVDGCNKTNFNAGSLNNWLPDCRNVNNATYSYIYSWMYVEQNADILCPAPWSVPERDDFVALNVALGGEAGGTQGKSEVRDRFVSEWGAEFGGRYTSNVFAVGSEGYYWSKTNYPGNQNAMCALSIFSNAGASVSVDAQGAKGHGLHVRCVITQ